MGLTVPCRKDLRTMQGALLQNPRFRPSPWPRGGFPGIRRHPRSNEAFAKVFQRILVICVGNICRSPTAQFMLRRHLPTHHVASAGLHALVGQSMDPTACDVLAAHGLDGSSHIARQLNTDMMHSSDLILTMEKAHTREISQIAPQALGRTMLLGKWLGEREIPDPYRQQRPAFEHVYQLIDAAVQAWLPYLGHT